ncbi:HK97 family phage prohead protease [Pseudonocardia asaccharolytica]|uniref:Prohead serine protease domain-containing protein n=1 Tax=Pseudonocardia asaccharolytica DSM 44247 = NBRC 16224 TaxID=1123024 RepID=A0A511CZI5_9PSEU|nr:HK97 family phage prohead protease [Pseudonocardia asaccharolytica]GEL17683.1 hypothetical protein PA7_15200 [Pseudonocardia asaccharolytica DSM 44247 = NBRC 16224]
MTELRRMFNAALEIRSPAQGGDGRIVEGIAVPYGVAMRIDADLVEQFAPGAFAHQIAAAHRVRFRRDHWQLIGRTLELREDAAGLWGAWQVARTAAGDDTLALIEGGALTDLSIGFRERQNRRLPDGTIERVTADLREVSVVDEGAYGEHATIAGVRAAAGDGDAVERVGLAECAQILGRLPVLSSS